ncbi:tyrosine-type recombinase/integrase [Lactococcus taiwanensis]|uniref:tyrosine-type recombinase/integrase n=1 Tax=Lactococcus taiwanensis TaxID=1151742 RepID=UPI0019653CF5|nr:site-specific integrase [Lactococcus taiwanensis]QRZ10212.1 site-specific integrase [Lactococcus taiwanensis]
MNIKKMTNGKYRFREKYRDTTGRWREVNVTMNSKNSESKRQAITILEGKIRAQKNKEIGESEKFQNLTVDDIYKKSAKKRRLELAESSFSQETYMIKNFLKDFGMKRITDVKARDIQDYIIDNAKSVKTMHAIKRGIGSIFRYAYVAEYISINPIDRLDLPKDTRTKESAAKLKQKFFSLPEFNQLATQMRHDADDEETHRKIDLIEFLFWTGLRIGEALGLMWTDVDLLDSKISINKSYNYHNRKMGNVKTVDSIREIDINQRCLEIIQNFKSYKSEFVFVTPKGKHIDYLGLTHYIKYEGAKAAIYGKNPDYYSMHMLRHSHVTYLVNQGVSQKMIMERVGHRDPRMMMGVYTHILPENRETLRQVINNSLHGAEFTSTQNAPRLPHRIMNLDESS